MVIVLSSKIIASVFCSDLLMSVLNLLSVWENSFFKLFKLVVFESTILFNLEILLLIEFLKLLNWISMFVLSKFISSINGGLFE